MREVLDRRPAVPWFEVHSENYFADGGPALATLERIRAGYPVALHGVGLSLGSTDALDREHLRKLKRLADRIDPALVSEHMCWSSVDGRHFNDLLPLPYNEDALDHLCTRVSEVQDYLGRTIAVENVSSYYAFPESTVPEYAFVAAVAARTGAKLLVDVNNIYVNALNAAMAGGRADAVAACEAWLDRIPPDVVGELHLAGHCAMEDIVIDDHGSRVAPEVWQLYRHALGRFGEVPTLIEWDTAIPPLSVLLEEAGHARSAAAQAHGKAFA